MVIGLGAKIEDLRNKALEMMTGLKQTEVSRKTGVHATQISRIKKAFQSRDTQAILKILERVLMKDIVAQL